MNNSEYIKKQITEHISYERSIQSANSGFCVQFYHPKSGKRITWSEKCTLVEKDLDMRVKRIEKKITKTNKS